MKKISFLAFVCCSLFFTNPISAQVEDEGQQIENCLLWKISNLTAPPSYVFAYIDGCCEANVINTDGMQEAFYDSQELIFDTDLSTPEAKNALAEGMRLPSKKNLKSFFENEQEYKNFNKKLMEKLDTAYSDAVSLNPLALSNFISAKNLGCQKIFDYKEDYARLAAEMSKPVSELENVKEYISLVNKIDIKDQKTILSGALENDNALQRNKLFANKDIRGLYALKNSQPGISSNSNDYFFYRNKRWASALKPKINEKSCYIVVDAANVGGENGLLMALLNEGFAIEPIVR